MDNRYLVQIKHLENTIAHERKQTEYFQEKCFSILRVNTSENPAKELTEYKPIGGSPLTPMRARAVAEANSREKYWKNKADKAENLPTIGTTQG